MRHFGEIKITRAAMCLMAVLLPISESGNAQTEDSSSLVLDEVIVTARKREETLQESPVAVSALSADALKEAGVANTRDLEQTVPGLNFGDQGSKSPSPFIRGVGQREAYSALDPGVGVYINGIYIPRTDGQLLDSVDTESIQVLRGPQGTLFGKNNTGGAILVTTKQPTNDGFSGYATTRLGNFGRRDAKVGANIPLNEDTMAMRVVINSTKSDGYMKNVVHNDYYGDEDRLAATARISWQATDTFNADVFAYWSKINEKSVGANCIYFDNPNSDFSILYFPDGKGGFITAKQACNESEALAKDNKVALNGPSVFQMQNGIAALTLVWDLGDKEIKSITAYSKQWNIMQQDETDDTGYTMMATGGGNIYDIMEQPVNAAIYDVDPENRHQFSQELQLIGSAFDESLSYTIGAFYSNEQINNTSFANAPGGGYSVFGYFGPPDLTTMRGSVLPKVMLTYGDLNNEAIALFAQSTYDINDYLQLTLGARYTRENRERNADYYSDDVPAIAALLGGTVSALSPLLVDNADLTLLEGRLDQTHPVELRSSIRAKKTFNRFTPMATLALKVPEDLLADTSIDSLMTYLTMSTGFKAGGFESKGEQMQSFKPETVKNIEVGFKADAFGQRIRFNTAFYRMQYDDMQLRIIQTSDTLGDFLVSIVNAGSATIQGVEMELSALLTEGLTLQATASYTDGFYDDFNGINANTIPPSNKAVDRSKEPYPAVPPLAYSLTLIYDFDTNIGLFTPRLNMTYHDGVYTGIDVDAGYYVDKATTDDVTLWNFRMGYTPANLDALNVALYVKNLTDETYFQGGLGLGETFGFAGLVQGPGREYGLEATYNF